MSIIQSAELIFKHEPEFLDFLAIATSVENLNMMLMRRIRSHFRETMSMESIFDQYCKIGKQ